MKTYAEDGDFDISSGIGVDASANVYVTDIGNDCIQVSSPGPGNL